MKLSFVILVTLAAAFSILGYYLFIEAVIKNTTYMYVFGFLVFGFIIVYILQAEIDWWWWQRKPPLMPEPLERQMGMLIPFYRHLNSVERKRFRDRVVLWVRAKDFSVKVLEEFPEEAKYMLAAYGVMLTFGIEKYLLQPYERVVLYPHPFPSPEHDYLHHSESHAEDGEKGVMIYNAAHLIPGINNPAQYYNLALHEYAGIFMTLYPSFDYPTFPESKWKDLERIRGASMAYVQEVVGIKNIDTRQVAIEHFFIQSARFKSILPKEYEQLCHVFNLDPLLVQMPVKDIQKIGFNPLKGE